MVTKFDSKDTAKAGSRWNPDLKKTVRNFEYKVSANLQTETSLLSFESFAYGRKAGSATLRVDLG